MNINSMQRIGDVCTSVSDTYHGKSDVVVLVNTSDVFNGRVLNHKMVENRGLRGQFKKTFKQNDILYSEIRPKNRRFAFVDFCSTDYIASTKLMVIRANSNKVLPQYLYYYLKSDAIISELQAVAETRSGTFPQITFSEMSNLSIPIPSLNIQTKIVKTIKCIEDDIDNNSKINDNLAA